MSSRTNIEELLQAQCEAQDERRFSDFLSSCAPSFSYKVVVQSAELRKALVWMELTRQEMADLYEMLPQQVRLSVQLSRFLNVVRVKPSTAPGHFEVKSALTIYATDKDGQTSLLAIGHYLDLLSVPDEGNATLAERTLHLTSRVIRGGSLEPL